MAETSYYNCGCFRLDRITSYNVCYTKLLRNNFDKMRLVFLGTSAAQPTENRGLSCICLEREGEIFMFDAGEAAQISYLKSGLGWNKKMKIFVTHLHGDHCIGILGLLQTMTMQHRTEPLEIYGPKGIDEFISANIRILNFGLSFPILISIIAQGKILESKFYSVYVCEASHSIVITSYSIHYTKLYDNRHFFLVRIEERILFLHLHLQSQEFA